MSPMYCPHCGGALTGYVPAIGGRCSSCRLVVGAGRARAEGAGDVRTGGFLANTARREGADPVAEGDAFVALRAVAAEVGCPVERLRMTDYDAAIRGGAEGPSVSAVLATFETWKAARLAASSRGALADDRAVRGGGDEVAVESPTV